MGTIYLLHFDRPYHHARHYIGYCEEGNLEARLQTHRKGQGAKLLDVITKAGIGFELVRTWEGDRNFERKLKNRKSATRLCPTCKKLKKQCPASTPSIEILGPSANGVNWPVPVTM